MRPALALEATNIESLLLAMTSPVEPPVHLHTSAPSMIIDEDVLDTLMAFCWYQHDTKLSTDFTTHALGVACTSGNYRYIAEVAFCLGSSYTKLGDFERAQKFLEEAHGSLKKLPRSTNILSVHG